MECMLWGFFDFQNCTRSIQLKIFDNKISFITVHVTHQHTRVPSSKLQNTKNKNKTGSLSFVPLLFSLTVFPLLPVFVPLLLNPLNFLLLSSITFISFFSSMIIVFSVGQMETQKQQKVGATERSGRREHNTKTGRKRGEEKGHAESRAVCSSERIYSHLKRRCFKCCSANYRHLVVLLPPLLLLSGQDPSDKRMELSEKKRYSPD